MTTGTPMSGRDTAAAYKGLLIGFVAILAIVLTIVTLTNRNYDAHHGAATTTESH